MLGRKLGLGEVRAICGRVRRFNRGNRPRIAYLVDEAGPSFLEIV